MVNLFNDIVRAFNMICRSTGLSYYELNILVYVFFIPLTWWAIAWWRRRRWHWVWLAHLGTPLAYYLAKERLERFSEIFYNANVAALWLLGGNTDAGYIRISIIAGVALPALIYLNLLLIPGRWVLQLYIVLLLINAGWYGWVLTQF